MRVGFTGTGKGMTVRQKVGVREAFVALGATTLHHGDCIGADAQAHAIARELGLRVVTHPGIKKAGAPVNHPARAFCDADEVRPVKPFPDRNTDIVLETAALVAAPRQKFEVQRSGTWMTVRRARKFGRPVKIVWP